MAVDEHSQEVIVGRIADAFGVKGQVKVRSFTEQPENLLQYRSWRVSGPSDSPQQYRVLHARFDGRFVIATLDGVDDRDRALELKGAEVSIDHEMLPKLGSEEFYWSDLIGMTVVGSNGEKIGVVTIMMETGANDVMVVAGQSEHLIPYVSDVVRQVDSDSGTIDVDWNIDF